MLKQCRLLAAGFFLSMIGVTHIPVAYADDYEVLHTFTTQDNNGRSRLLQADDGDLYGTTGSGGANDVGTVYKITTNGVYSTLYSFDGANGAVPTAGLIQGADGAFYGTTSQGGNDGFGTVFRITKAGVVTMLLSFDNGNLGGSPQGELIQATDGVLYGTAKTGGTDGWGTVFSVTTNGVWASVKSFSLSEGAVIYAPLVQGTDGNLYGIASDGGDSYNGTLFKITLPGGTFTRLHSFALSEGAHLLAGLTEGPDGNFYGVGFYGGSGSNGTIYKSTPDGTLTRLKAFNGANGMWPEAELTFSSDGGFYGTTSFENTGNGTVFRVDTNGVFYTVYTFTSAGGFNPRSQLIEATDGYLYGTTSRGGGPNDAGTIFRLVRPPAPPVITTQPSPTLATIGSSASFNVVAENGPLTYQWLFGGSPINDETNSSVTISSVSNSDLGDYSVVVTGPGGTVTSSTALLFLAASITSQPTSVVVEEGQDTSFSVTAINGGSLSYQWLFNEAPISGANSSTLNITGATSAEVGTYSVIVNGTGNSVTSAPAQLYLKVAITDQPVSVFGIVGGTATFNVTAINNPTGYQWRLNGTPISGATNSSLTINNIKTTSVGNYSVVVTGEGAGNSVVSQSAKLSLVAGTFTGLFSESEPKHESSGYFEFKVDSARKLSGKITIEGGAYAMKTQLDTSLHANFSIPRVDRPSNLTVDLQISTVDDTMEVHGSVDNGTWNAELIGDLAYYNNTRLTDQAGDYTFTLLVNGDGTDAPGYGTFGEVSVKTNGAVKLGGKLSDRTTLNQASYLSKQGYWPLYVSLYKGAGSVSGWIQFDKTSLIPLDGDVSWIKTNASGPFYATGFTNLTYCIGSQRR